MRCATCVRSSAGRTTRFRCCGRFWNGSRAAIVHSEAVRAGDFAPPDSPDLWPKCPMGRGLVDADRMAYRTLLGLDETTPLIGIFGFLKPYKRIAEALRAFEG